VKPTSYHLFIRARQTARQGLGHRTTAVLFPAGNTLRKRLKSLLKDLKTTKFIYILSEEDSDLNQKGLNSAREERAVCMTRFVTGTKMMIGK
jgi:hypothetical protein